MSGVLESFKNQLWGHFGFVLEELAGSASFFKDCATFGLASRSRPMRTERVGVQVEVAAHGAACSGQRGRLGHVGRGTLPASMLDCPFFSEMKVR